MSLQISSSSNSSVRRRTLPAVSCLTRYALVPLERARVKLVAVQLVTDMRRNPTSRLEIGVRHREQKLLNGDPVYVWGQVEWLDATRYAGLLTEEEARAWMANGFEEAANDAR